MTHPTARHATLVVAAMTLLSISAAAQQTPAPQPAPQPAAPMGQMDHQMPMGQMNHQMMGNMGNMGGMAACPMMGEHGAPAAAPDTAAVRATADQHATFTRAYYLALVRKGFTAEQALRIITSQPAPGGR